MKPTPRKKTVPKKLQDVKNEENEGKTVVGEEGITTKHSHKKVKSKERIEKQAKGHEVASVEDQVKSLQVLSDPSAEEEDVNLDVASQIGTSKELNFEHSMEDEGKVKGSYIVQGNFKENQKNKKRKVEVEDGDDFDGNVSKHPRVMPDQIMQQHSFDSATLATLAESLGRITVVDVKSLLGEAAVTSSHSSGRGQGRGLPRLKIGPDRPGMGTVAYTYRPRLVQGSPRPALQGSVFRPRFTSTPGVRRPVAPRLVGPRLMAPRLVGPRLMGPGMSPRQGAGMARRLGAEMAPRLGPGMVPRLGAGMAPRQGAGMVPRLGPGMAPRLGAGMAPRLGAGMAPRLGAGMAPRLGSGLASPPGPCLSKTFIPKVLTFSPIASRCVRPINKPSLLAAVPEHEIVTIEDDEVEEERVRPLLNLPSCITVLKKNEGSNLEISQEIEVTRHLLTVAMNNVRREGGQWVRDGVIRTVREARNKLDRLLNKLEM